MANPDSDYAHFFPEARKTRLPGGYMGKILRVDLTTGKLRNLNLPEEPLLRKYWGGQLLAEYVLMNELPLDIDPYDPRNVIVGMTGPVTGTGLTPGGTKMCFVYLSPATRRTLGRGATSGYLGTAFKAAGYDGVIVSGAAASPIETASCSVEIDWSMSPCTRYATPRAAKDSAFGSAAARFSICAIAIRVSGESLIGAPASPRRTAGPCEGTKPPVSRAWKGRAEPTADASSASG